MENPVINVEKAITFMNTVYDESHPTNKLFVDGGVIRKNPSTIGGTWAWRHINPDGKINSGSGVITPSQAGMPAITNNLTEMLALLYGLSNLPRGWVGTVYSDSAITLGRAFMGWRWSGIPSWMLDLYKINAHHINDKVRWVQLDGHPTKAQLLSGIGKRGNPVSEHNVWCDAACGRAGEHYLAGLAHEK